MDINFTLTLKEFVNFYATYFCKTNNYKSRIIKIYIIAVPMLTIAVFIIGRPFKFIQAIIALIIFTIIKNKFFFKYTQIILNRSFSLDKFKYLFKFTSLNVNNYTIKLTTELCETTFTWNSLKNLCVLNDYIFIVTMYGKNILIPCKCFENEIDKDIFLKHITDNSNIKIQTTFPKDFIYFA